MVFEAAALLAAGESGVVALLAACFAVVEVFAVVAVAAI